MPKSIPQYKILSFFRVELTSVIKYHLILTIASFSFADRLTMATQLPRPRPRPKIISRKNAQSAAFEITIKQTVEMDRGNVAPSINFPPNLGGVSGCGASGDSSAIYRLSMAYDSKHELQAMSAVASGRFLLRAKIKALATAQGSSLANVRGNYRER